MEISDFLLCTLFFVLFAFWLTAHRGEGLNAERRRDRDEPDGESGQAEIRTINNSFTIEFFTCGSWSQRSDRRINPASWIKAEKKVVSTNPGEDCGKKLQNRERERVSASASKLLILGLCHIVVTVIMHLAWINPSHGQTHDSYRFSWHETDVMLYCQWAVFLNDQLCNYTTVFHLRHSQAKHGNFPFVPPSILSAMRMTLSGFQVIRYWSLNEEARIHHISRAF